MRVLRYSDLHATDATGCALPAHLEFLSLNTGEGRGVRVVMDATAAVYPITIDLLATTPNWAAESNQADTWFGFSTSTAGDVNKIRRCWLPGSYAAICFNFVRFTT